MNDFLTSCFFIFPLFSVVSYAFGQQTFTLKNIFLESQWVHELLKMLQ